MTKQLKHHVDTRVHIAVRQVIWRMTDYSARLWVLRRDARAAFALGEAMLAHMLRETP